MPAVSTKNSLPVFVIENPNRSDISRGTTGKSIYKDIKSNKLAIHIRIDVVVYNTFHYNKLILLFLVGEETVFYIRDIAADSICHYRMQIGITA